MDLLKPLIRHITYPYFLKRDGYATHGYEQALAQSQYFTPVQLAEHRTNLLRTLLQYCQQHNAFYRERIEKCNIDINNLTSIDVLTKLPILTKDDIRKAGDNLFSISHTAHNSVHKRTGGSTGVPLHVYMDYQAASQKKAATLRHNAWAHLVPGNRLAAVWGDTQKKQPWRTRIRNMLTERIFWLDTLQFTDENLELFIDRLKKYRPPVIMGHAHSIFRLAEYVRSRGYKDINFDGIITTAMVLNISERNAIEEIFESKVFNRYGCEELSIIASECEAHEGMHIFAEGLIVECIGATRKLPGKLVVTDLLNKAMPLIRYEIGDYGILTNENCSCGRTLPRLLEVSGRTADFLYRPDGTPVFGISILDTFVIHITGLKQVQIIQDEYNHLDFLVVRDKSYSEDSKAHLARNVLEIFGSDMTYDIKYVNTIPQTERGKFRFSICKIDRENTQ